VEGGREARPRRREKSRGRRRGKEKDDGKGSVEGAARDGSSARCASHSAALFRSLFTAGERTRVHSRETRIDERLRAEIKQGALFHEQTEGNTRVIRLLKLEKTRSVSARFRSEDDPDRSVSRDVSDAFYLSI